MNRFFAFMELSSRLVAEKFDSSNPYKSRKKIKGNSSTTFGYFVIGKCLPFYLWQIVHCGVYYINSVKIFSQFCFYIFSWLLVGKRNYTICTEMGEENAKTVWSHWNLWSNKTAWITFLDKWSNRWSKCLPLELKIWVRFSIKGKHIFVIKVFN